jgi:hypothetical protein
LLAEDKPVKNPAPTPADAVDLAFAFPKGVQVTDEQQAKITALKTEYAAQVEGMQAARAALYREVNTKETYEHSQFQWLT